MMRCPKCRAQTRVHDSRKVDVVQRRRRICDDCGHDFRTIEVVDYESVGPIPEPPKPIKFAYARLDRQSGKVTR